MPLKCLPGGAVEKFHRGGEWWRKKKEGRGGVIWEAVRKKGMGEGETLLNAISPVAERCRCWVTYSQKHGEKKGIAGERKNFHKNRPPKKNTSVYRNGRQAQRHKGKSLGKEGFEEGTRIITWMLREKGVQGGGEEREFFGSPSTSVRR